MGESLVYPFWRLFGAVSKKFLNYGLLCVVSRKPLWTLRFGPLLCLPFPSRKFSSESFWGPSKSLLFTWTTKFLSELHSSRQPFQIFPYISCLSVSGQYRSPNALKDCRETSSGRVERLKKYHLAGRSIVCKTKKGVWALDLWLKIFCFWFHVDNIW